MFKPWMTVILLLACVVLEVTLVRNKPSVFNPPVQERASFPPRQHAAEMLRRKIPEIAADDEPLERVLQKLVSVTGITLSVRWPVRSEYDTSAAQHQRIRIHSSNVTVEQALTDILNQTGFKFVAGDGVIIVSEESFEPVEDVETRIYNIRDIIKSGRLGDATGRSAWDNDPVSIAVGAGSDLQRHSQKSGNFGSFPITQLMGLLIVTETPENQARVAAFLERLRASNDEQFWRSATRPATEPAGR
jgi:hypothetical protein